MVKRATRKEKLAKRRKQEAADARTEATAAKKLAPAKKRKPKVPPPPLYIGQWIARLELKQEHVAKDAKIGKSYLSLLCSGKKGDLSASVLYRLSQAMGVPMNAFYQPPPTRQEVQKIRQLGPEAIRALTTDRGDEPPRPPLLS